MMSGRYYFRIAASFETKVPKYAWINNIVGAVEGSGEPIEPRRPSKDD